MVSGVPGLQSDALRGHAEGMARQLLVLLEPDEAARLNGAVAITAYSAIGALGRADALNEADLEGLFDYSVAAFQELASDLLGRQGGDGGGGAGAASLKKALASGMMQLLKAGVVADKPHGRLPELLAALGAGEDAVTTALRMGSGRRAEQERSRGMKRSRYEAAGKEVSGKRARGAPADSRTAAPTGPPPTSPMELNQVRRIMTGFRRAGNVAGLDQFLGQLPPPVLADMVLAGMPHVPARLGRQWEAGQTRPQVFGGERALHSLLGGLGLGAIEFGGLLEDDVDDPAALVSEAKREALSEMEQMSHEDKAELRQSALERLLESGQPGKATSGTRVRALLVGRLAAIEVLTAEGSGWTEPVQKILLDNLLALYQAQRGHALAMGVLYAICTCEQVVSLKKNGKPAPKLPLYESFFIALVELVREGVPPHERALARLLMEAPMLPGDKIVGILQAMCQPVEASDGTENGSGKGEEDRDEGFAEASTLALTVCRDLILNRPGIRYACLDLVLKCSISKVAELRGKAIRLIANKLYPVSALRDTVEGFAVSSLEDFTTMAEQGGVPAATMAPETSRHSELLFALCTKNHELLRLLLMAYSAAPAAAKDCMYNSVDALALAVGPDSAELVNLAADVPAGGEDLLLKILITLADRGPLPEKLVASVESLYTAHKDPKYLVPALAGLEAHRLLALLPQLVAGLPARQFQAAMALALKDCAKTGGLAAPGRASPVDVLITLHLIDPRSPGAASLSKVKDAITCCFRLPEIFNGACVSATLNKLSDMRPFPLLFMRTAIQACKAFPDLNAFLVELQRKLIARQVWTDKQQWEGFLRCVKMTAPKSLPALLGLPTPFLEQALSKIPDLFAPLQRYASNPAVFATTPQSTLSLLKLLTGQQ